jgi:hypothetical protein
MDKRKYNGSKAGENRNAGRKPKATELQLVERLTPLEDIALKALEKGIKSGELGFVKLFLEYRFGKPKQMQEITVNGNGLRDWNIVVVREEPKIKLPDGKEVLL